MAKIENDAAIGNAELRFVPELINPELWKRHPRNYRIHPEDEIAHIVESIKLHGIYRNIVVAKENTILAGHGVVQACLKMKLAEIPIVRLNISPDDPRALKVLTGDNEIGHLSEIDDRALTQMLKDINESDSLLGTGFDEKMLANLLMVTRDANEIQDFNTAAAWVGMPEYENGGPQYKLIVNFANPDDREKFAALHKVEIASKGNITWSTRWPYAPSDDCRSVRFEPEAPKIPKTRDHEWTGITNRDIFEEFPGMQSSEAQQQRWIDFRADYHQMQESLSDREFPLQIDFELNSSCDMKCAFCIHGQKKKQPKREISLDQFKRVIDEGERHGLCSIKLNDVNEPLLNKRLPEYIRYAKEHGVLNVYFSTNGTHLSREVGVELIEAGLSKIMISIDATTKETYRKIRGFDRFESVCKNVRDFVALRAELNVAFPRVRVNFLKTELNIAEADAFIKEWEGIAESIGFQDENAVTGSDNIEEMRRLLRLQDDPDFRCSFPFKLVSINSAGFIQPCCTFYGREMPLGHIDSMTIKEAWDSEFMREIRELHRQGRFQEIKNCRMCVTGKGGAE